MYFRAEIRRNAPNNLHVRSACQAILIEQRDGEIDIDHRPEMGGAAIGKISSERNGDKNSNYLILI